MAATNEDFLNRSSHRDKYRPSVPVWYHAIAILLVVGNCSPHATAQPYHMVGVDMDLPDGHPNRIGATIGRDRVDPPTPEEFDVNGNGYRYPNRAGVTIRGMRLQIAAPARDRFDPHRCHGGRLFASVRVLHDGKVVEFGDGQLLDRDEAWIYMPDNADGNRVIYYLGEALSTDPIPDNFQISAKAGQTDRQQAWHYLLRACPSRYRNITAYGESPSMEHICIFTNGLTFLYNTKKSELAEVFHHGKMEDNPINHISFERSSGDGDEFVLWSNGRSLARIGTANAEKGVTYTAK